MRALRFATRPRRARSRRRARPPLRLVSQRARAGRPARLFPAAREQRGAGVAEGDGAETVAAPAREVADGDRDALGDVGLAPLGRAELHRGRRVEDEPRDEHALGEMDANVRLAGSGGHVPLDRADVVARKVGADLGELGPLAEEARPVVAGQQAVDPAPDRDVERTEEGVRDRPGAGPVGRRSPRERVEVPHAALDLVRSTCGTGTAWSTRPGCARGSPPRRAPGR